MGGAVLPLFFFCARQQRRGEGILTYPTEQIKRYSRALLWCPGEGERGCPRRAATNSSMVRTSASAEARRFCGHPGRQDHPARRPGYQQPRKPSWAVTPATATLPVYRVCQVWRLRMRWLRLRGDN